MSTSNNVTQLIEKFFSSLEENDFENCERISKILRYFTYYLYNYKENIKENYEKLKSVEYTYYTILSVSFLTMLLSFMHLLLLQLRLSSSLPSNSSVVRFTYTPYFSSIFLLSLTFSFFIIYGVVILTERSSLGIIWDILQFVKSKLNVKNFLSQSRNVSILLVISTMLFIGYFIIIVFNPLSSPGVLIFFDLIYIFSCYVTYKSIRNSENNPAKQLNNLITIKKRTLLLRPLINSAAIYTTLYLTIYFLLLLAIPMNYALFSLFTFILFIIISAAAAKRIVVELLMIREYLYPEFVFKLSPKVIFLGVTLYLFIVQFAWTYAAFDVATQNYFFIYGLADLVARILNLKSYELPMYGTFKRLVSIK